MSSTAGFAPASLRSEVSVTYTTGYIVHIQLHVTKTTPGNHRKELGASALRCLSIRDYAPAPQREPLRQVCLPARSSSWRSNSSLSPPAYYLSSLVRHTYLQLRSRPTVETKSTLLALLNHPEGTNEDRSHKGQSINSRSTWLLRHSGNRQYG